MKNTLCLFIWAIATAIALAAPPDSIPNPAFRQQVPPAGPAPEIRIGAAHSFQLPNGLKVIFAENHKLPRVSFRIFVDYDPVQEGSAAGYVDMAGGLLRTGTRSRTKAQIDEEIDFIGGSLSTNARGVSGACLTKHADKLLNILSDVLLNPVFPEAELEKARRQAESGLVNRKDNAEEIAASVADRLNYGTHPYGEMMTETTLPNITLARIKQHYQANFRPNIAYLVITGDLTRDRAEQLARQYFGSWKKGKVVPRPYPVPRLPQKTQVSFIHKPDAVQSVITITYPVQLPPGSADVISAKVMNTILGDYFNSRVNGNLREGKGYTYGAFTALESDRLAGSFMAQASVRNAVTDSALTEFFKEFELLRNSPTPGPELQTVKSVMTGIFSQSLERPGVIADFALAVARYKLPADYYAKYLTRLSEVSDEQVMAAARKFLLPAQAHILVVGNQDEVAEKLRRFAPDGQINFLDIYGNPLK